MQSYSFLYFVFFMLLFISVCLIVVVDILSRNLKSERLRCHILQLDKEDWRNLLIERLRADIQKSLNEKSQSLKAKSKSTVLADKDASEEIKENVCVLYKEQISAFRAQYPDLTDLDVLVIVLLGMGLDNVEVALLLQMEKRTLYRRRQLIAQRIGISSLEIDDLAKNLLL